MWRDPVLKCWHIKPTAQSNLYSLQWQMAASYTFLPIKSQIYFGKSCKTRVADFSPLDKSATYLNIYLEILTKIGITFPPAKCTVFGWSQVRFLPGGRQMNLPILVNIFSPHHYYAQVPYNLSQCGERVRPPLFSLARPTCTWLLPLLHLWPLLPHSICKQLCTKYWLLDHELTRPCIEPHRPKLNTSGGVCEDFEFDDGSDMRKIDR